MDTWQLFIDESGSFGSRAEPNLVTGLLVNEPWNDELPTALHGALHDGLPLVPYPPHATDLRIPVSRVAAARLYGEPRTTRDEAVARRLAAVADAIRTSDSAAPQGFCMALDEGSWPDQGRLRRCDSWLRAAHPEHHALLRGLVDEQDAAMRSLFDCLAKHYGPQRCFVVGAANEVSNAPIDDTPDPDLYLQLLEALFERLVALLRSRSGPIRVVRIHAAVRNVRRGFVAARKTSPLSMQALADVARRALQFPIEGVPTPGVPSVLRFVAHEPKSANSDAKVHPGVVLADYLSNRLWGAIQAHADWATLREGAIRRFSLDVRAVAATLAPAGPLPAIASDGLARAAVRDAFDGGRPQGLSGLEPRWVGQQAAYWIQAATMADARGEA